MIVPSYCLKRVPSLWCEKNWGTAWQLPELGDGAGCVGSLGLEFTGQSAGKEGERVSGEGERKGEEEKGKEKDAH